MNADSICRADLSRRNWMKAESPKDDSPGQSACRAEAQRRRERERRPGKSSHKINFFSHRMGEGGRRPDESRGEESKSPRNFIKRRFAITARSANLSRIPYGKGRHSGSQRRHQLSRTGKQFHDVAVDAGEAPVSASSATLILRSPCTSLAFASQDFGEFRKLIFGWRRNPCWLVQTAAAKVP